MPPDSTLTVPCSGAVTDATRRRLPSGALTFARTSTSVGSSSGVSAVSSAATGASGSSVTLTTTVALAVSRFPLRTLSVSRYSRGPVS